MKTARLLEFIERGKRIVLKAQREYEQREAVIRRAQIPSDADSPRAEAPKSDVEHIELRKGA
jgi:hypothetical protein